MFVTFLNREIRFFEKIGFLKCRVRPLPRAHPYTQVEMMEL
jgi:hypothetical protein